MPGVPAFQLQLASDGSYAMRSRGDSFAIERRIPGGGTIRDAFSIVESGHLLLTREIVWRRARPVGLIVYGKRS